jgi:hypothetical protein
VNGHPARGGPASTVRWRLSIATLFLLCFLIQMAMATWVLLRGAINPGSYAPLVAKLLSIYSVPIGVIVGGIFAAKGTTRRATVATVWTVLALTGVWNLLLTARYVLFALAPAGTDSIPQLKEFQDAMVSGGSFLLNGALAYLYGGHQA